jgi:hypothetical protein
MGRETSLSLLGHVLLLCLANACLFAAGAGVTRALGVWSGIRELRAYLGTSYMAGVAAYGVTAQFLYVVGAPLSLWQIGVVCAALAATGLAARPGGGRSLPLRRFARAELVCAAAAAVLLLVLGVDAVFQPLASWDAWTQWTPKAHALVVDNGLNAHVLGSKVYRDWHLDYPLLVPGIEAFAFRFVGFDVRVVHFQQWFFLLGFSAAFVELLRPRVRPLFVWAVLLALLAAPRVEGDTLASNADIPLAVFLGLAGIAALIWIIDWEPIALRLFAVFAAAALATKVEGTYLVLILLLTTLVVVARRSRPRFRATALAGVAAAAVGIVPWRIWVSLQDLPPTYSIRDALGGDGWHDPSRGPISTLVVLGEFFSPRAWLLLAPLSLIVLAALSRRYGRSGHPWRVAVAAVAAGAGGLIVTLLVPGPNFPFPWRGSDWLVFAAAVIPLAALAYYVLRTGSIAAWAFATSGLMVVTFILVYVVTPYPFAWHLGTSSARVVIGPEIFLAALLPLLLERASVPEPPVAGVS